MLYCAVAEDAQAEGIDYMLVGATARDILLKHVFGLETRRATYDVDFAVAVRDWHQFDSLRNRLLARHDFKAGHVRQRLFYQGEDGQLNYPLDMLPFGGIARETNAIAWPPDMAVVMNVAGYGDVLAASETVEFAPGFAGKVVSLAGLAILKLVAWSDRGRENPKDAHDLIQLMDSYPDAGNQDRIYDEGAMDAVDYRMELAGPFLLGTDMRRLANDGTLALLRNIIDSGMDRLVLDMIRSRQTLDDTEPPVALRLQTLRNTLS